MCVSLWLLLHTLKLHSGATYKSHRKLTTVAHDMESMDIFVRGTLMQNPGLGSLGLIDLGGLEWAWVAVVATIVVAVVSVKRVSLVSVGLSWRDKPGRVRVRVQSFSSCTDGNCIVTASGMFSAELLKSSEAEVQDPLESAADASKVAAEMVFIFEKKTTSVVLPKLSSVLRAEKSKTRCKVRASSTSSPVPHSGPHSNEGKASVSRSEGIEWDSGTPTASISGRRIPSFLSPHNFTTFDMAGHIRSLTTPLASTNLLRKVTPCMFKNSTSSDWDPTLKMRMCDAVLGGSENFLSGEVKRLPLAPITRGSENLVTLKNAVVRLWDRNDRSVLNSVNLPTGYGSASAFDVDWENEVAAVARVDGSLSVAHLDRAMYEKTFHSQQSVIQALRFDWDSSSNTLISGECATANAGYSVSLWDTRTSNRQLHTKLDSAAAIYGLTFQGHELYVQDQLSSLSDMDLRMLRSNVGTISSGLKEVEPVAPEDKWWDCDVGVVNEEEGDDDFWDCGSMDEVKGGGGTLMGSFVLAVSRSFSSKSLGR